jgi:hypothetical protein
VKKVFCDRLEIMQTTCQGRQEQGVAERHILFKFELVEATIIDGAKDEPTRVVVKTAVK